MKAFRALDELKGAVGTHLGESEWRTITQAEVDLFAEATGDDHWSHIDPQRAKSGPFGGTIAPGYLTLSIIPGLVREIFTVEGIRMSLDYGTNKVRFPAPYGWDRGSGRAPTSFHSIPALRMTDSREFSE